MNAVVTKIGRLGVGRPAFALLTSAVLGALLSFGAVLRVEAAPVDDFVTRFYSNVLGRSPDSAGKAQWVSLINANCNAQEFDSIARGFFDSTEFRTVKPLSLTGLVTTLYQTFLGRNPDPTGLAGWASLIRQARLTIALQGFIPSHEFQGLLPDRTNRAAVTAVVTRLYQQVLGRNPEPAGLQAWVDFIVTTGNLEAAAQGFLASQEFESHAQTFRDYVTTLYRTFLNRDPEPAGLDAWEAILRDTLLQIIDAGFVPSAEFQGLVPQVCAPANPGAIFFDDFSGEFPGANWVTAHPTATIRQDIGNPPPSLALLTSAEIQSAVNLFSTENGLTFSADILVQSGFSNWVIFDQNGRLDGSPLAVVSVSATGVFYSIRSPNTLHVFFNGAVEVQQPINFDTRFHTYTFKVDSRGNASWFRDGIRQASADGFVSQNLVMRLSANISTFLDNVKVTVP